MEGALTALLYLFLLQLFWLLWRDLARAQRGATGVSIGLTTVEGPSSVVGHTVQLPSPATVGRAPGNTLALPAETVSLSHMRLVYRNGAWWVEDLGSTNGTVVNGVRVAALTRLGPGDILGCGPEVRFRLHDLPAA